MIEIRELSSSDKMDDLILLSGEFFQEYEHYHKDFFKISQLKNEHIISYFSSFCGSEWRKAYIAYEGLRMVGYITVYVKDQADYWQIKRLGEISGLMVKQQFRRMGIAKLLLAKAREFFESTGIKYYTVYTAVENRGAIDFYQQNGCVPLYSTLVAEV